ncbi:glycoside hydrolase family 64 protein [Streptomyces sp. Tu 2975]|uniref:glycoside hydrolase family 64 protein n=1 Tax=Streptomyces sp. Tu 2975 TaxID=2676871 RepID=UPI001ABEB6A4|nr:glycoside hydrolase family 64 protein [Streptomyces sp. Tu 2975]
MFLTGAAATATALTYPAWGSALSPGAGAAPATCELALENESLPGTVNAYVTGHEDGSGDWVLLRADGSVHKPADPPAPRTPLPVDCAIPLKGAGEGPVVLTLPRMFGARVYFVRDDKLDFFVNPGPSLVEPAFATPADPNYGRTWSFCEFTFNAQQLYANISYVDLVTALPIGLTLTGDATHAVAPLPQGALEKIADDLAAQAGRDGQPWDKLVIRSDAGTVLRVISPQTIMAPYFDRPAEMPFRDVFDGYIDKVWEKYRSEDLRVDLQGGRGVLAGRVSGDVLSFPGGHTFTKPSSRDVFTCNHGPFANNPADPDDKKALLARISAAFNRSTLLTHPDQPNGATSADYYRDPTTNHWSRIVHANSPIGYAFPYDDVRPDGRPDVSGAAHDGNPKRFTVSVGS